MSSRGQVVIPVALRQAAGISEGDELEVVFDGQRLFLGRPDQSSQATLDAPEGRDPQLLRETRTGYLPAAAGPGAGIVRRPALPSEMWAERVRALAAIRRLRADFAGIEAGALHRESRRELEDRERS